MLVLAIIGALLLSWFTLGFIGWLLHLHQEGWGKGLHNPRDEWFILVLYCVLGPVPIYVWWKNR